VSSVVDIRSNLASVSERIHAAASRVGRRGEDRRANRVEHVAGAAGLSAGPARGLLRPHAAPNRGERASDEHESVWLRYLPQSVGSGSLVVRIFSHTAAEPPMELGNRRVSRLICGDRHSAYLVLRDGGPILRPYRSYHAA